MMLEQISLLSQTIAALAVIASLVYAALQFRLYANAAREGRFLTAMAAIQDFQRIIATDADCARIFRDGLDDLTKLSPVDRWRFGSMMQLIVANIQAVVELEDVGGYQFYSDTATVAVMSRPGARLWWSRGRDLFSPATVAMIDRVLKVADVHAPSASSSQEEVARSAGGDRSPKNPLPM